MSRIEKDDPCWRLHDHYVDERGGRWLIFRRSVVFGDDDYWVHSSVFAGQVSIRRGDGSE